jgi:Glycoside hydrolase family 44
MPAKKALGLIVLLLSSCILRKPVTPPPTPGATSAGSRAALDTPARRDLLGGDGLHAFSVHGDAKKVVVTDVPVEGQSFAQALRITINEASGSDWSVQLQAPTAAPVQKGDVLLATFHVRAVKSQEGSGAASTQFVFEHAGEPYTKSVTYPVRFGTDWRKIQVRFLVEESYPQGRAQMIFRLGYEPETFEIAAVTVENFGNKVSLWDLPASEQADHRAELALAEVESKAAPLPAVDGGDLTFEVSADKHVGSISPYVYGISSQNLDKLNVTVRRMGGNRQTAYNWELNASNAGSDANHLNDAWPCTTLGYEDCAEPGTQVTNFVAENRRAGAESVVTIPLSDYVSADKNGPVAETDAAPSRRFVRSVPRKIGAYSAVPDLRDGVAYQDEFVAFLVKKLGTADHGGPKFYSLDNEPALWPSTHPRIHPKPTTYAEIVRRSETTAAAITEIDPSAMVLGAVAYGWSEYMTLQSAPDARAETARLGATQNYLEYFLESMKRLEDKYHRRLVHVLDIHWYPEPKGTARITEKDVSSKTVAVRLQAPRSLWDPTYVEKSWITDTWGRPIRLIPWLQETIAQHYPGTKLSITEYNYGAGGHISGGLAQVDVLGIFGRDGLYLANYWGTGAGVGDLPDYIAGAFKLYRNYDAAGGTFGDTAVAATVADVSQASIYAAIDSRRPGLLTIIAINKSQQSNFKAKLEIRGAASYGSAQAYVLASDSPSVKPLGKIEIKNNRIAYPLGRLSATLFVCQKR